LLRRAYLAQELAKLARSQPCEDDRVASADAQRLRQADHHGRHRSGLRMAGAFVAEANGEGGAAAHRGEFARGCAVSALPYHKRYHGDALTGFMALTLEERGAYQTLLDMMYDRGGPLIDNERLLAGYMNCSIRKWRQLRESLLEKRKIRINRDGQITNGRAEKEIENQSKTHRKLIEAGAKGGRTRAEKEKNANENNESAQASLEPALSDPQAIPEARSQNSSEDKSSGGEPPANRAKNQIKELFDLGVSILTDGGVDEREARSLVGKWKKDRGEVEVLQALLECQRGDISEPVEWLTKRLQKARYVSKSGYEYRGDQEAVLREADKRGDMDTYWRVKGDMGRERAATAGVSR
jgi:uncharacterized protein YdaU (DUF1376 family)